MSETLKEHTQWALLAKALSDSGSQPLTLSRETTPAEKDAIKTAARALLARAGFDVSAKDAAKQAAEALKSRNLLTAKDGDARGIFFNLCHFLNDPALGDPDHKCIEAVHLLGRFDALRVDSPEALAIVAPEGRPLAVLAKAAPSVTTVSELLAFLSARPGKQKVEPLDINSHWPGGTGHVPSPAELHGLASGAAGDKAYPKSFYVNLGRVLESLVATTYYDKRHPVAVAAFKAGLGNVIEKIPVERRGTVSAMLRSLHSSKNAGIPDDAIRPYFSMRDDYFEQPPSISLGVLIDFRRGRNEESSKPSPRATKEFYEALGKAFAHAYHDVSRTPREISISLAAKKLVIRLEHTGGHENESDFKLSIGSGPESRTVSIHLMKGMDGDDFMKGLGMHCLQGAALIDEVAAWAAHFAAHGETRRGDHGGDRRWAGDRHGTIGLRTAGARASH